MVDGKLILHWLNCISLVEVEKEEERGRRIGVKVGAI
jgi:hypothetical protein